GAGHPSETRRTSPVRPLLLRPQRRALPHGRRDHEEALRHGHLRPVRRCQERPGDRRLRHRRLPGDRGGTRPPPLPQLRRDAGRRGRPVCLRPHRGAHPREPAPRPRPHPIRRSPCGI
ncbi:MAG: Arsenate reductase thioredoxin-coupled, partial [uncultured Rubellimicrobium sp.]